MLQAVTSDEISLAVPWLVDLSHLMLAVATASNVGVLAAQDLSFRHALVRDLRHGCVFYQPYIQLLRFLSFKQREVENLGNFPTKNDV